jgi:hypothetical protein
VNRRSKLSLLVAALAVSTCVPPAAPARTHGASTRGAPRDATRTVIVVAIDGVRYEDVFVGADPELSARHGIPAGERRDASRLLPNLTRLATESGASLGAPGVGEIAASGPNFVSLPGYMEILTGRTRTGCTDNQCGRVPFTTIADEIASTGNEAGVVTSWPDIGKAASAAAGSIVASVGRHGGSRRDVLESDPRVGPLLREGEHGGPHPGYGDFRPDAQTGDVALAYLESRRPAFLFVGLGETDEYGHRDDYRSYLAALSRADAIIGRLAEVAAALRREGHETTLFVTTDHGREKAFESHGREHPESARVFLLAAGAGIAARGRVTSPETRHLADLAPTIRHLVGLPPTTSGDAGHPLTELLRPARGAGELRLVDVR